MNDLSSLTWLTGRWRGERGGRVLMEEWLAPHPRRMVGSGWIEAEGKVPFVEHLELAATQEGIVYWASVPGQRAVPFRLVEQGPRRAAFANPQHDHPKRITYERTGEVLRARIEGVEAGKPKVTSFTWKAAPTGVPEPMVDLNPGPGGSTEVVLVQRGFRHGPDWIAGRTYFERAWSLVLERLRRSFAEGPTRW